MRLAGLTAALALVGAVPAAAQTVPPLAPDEVLLEVGKAPNGQIETRVRIAVDFALTPRR